MEELIKELESKVAELEKELEDKKQELKSFARDVYYGLDKLRDTAGDLF
jgi:peptidoglycan hydrolase CwlO-like protein